MWKLDEEFKKSDLEDVFYLIEGTNSDSLNPSQKEINEMLEEEEKESEEKKNKRQGVNPFLALIGKYEKKEKPAKKEVGKKSTLVLKDSWVEKEVIRPFAKEKVVQTAFNLFNIYKKAHGMPSYI